MTYIHRNFAPFKSFKALILVLGSTSTKRMDYIDIAFNIESGSNYLKLCKKLEMNVIAHKKQLLFQCEIMGDKFVLMNHNPPNTLEKFYIFLAL